MPHCPLCQYPHCRPAAAVGGYAVHACPECRSEFLYPQPDDATLQAIYSEDYFLGSGNAAAMLRRSEMKSGTGARYVEKLARLLPPGGALLLEIGCGHGEVLAEARKRGFRVAGLEFSAHAAALANQRLGEPAVLSGALETARFSQAPFDAILAADVIEHVRDPQAFLERTGELLRPGGVLMLITPSLDSWSRRFMRRRWMEYKVEHLFYFSAAALRRIIDRAGYTDVQIRPNRKVLTIDYLWRHFARFRVPGITAAVGLFRRILPGSLAHRHLLVPASGLLLTARKRSVPPTDPESLRAAGNRPVTDAAPAKDTAR